MNDKNENILSTLGTKFTEDLNVIVQKVLVRSGVKQDSELVESVGWEYSRDSLLMYVADYYETVSKGRPPLKKKIPIYALVQWIKANNISSTKYPTGRLAFVLQTSIYKNGIRGKNFIDIVQGTVSDAVEIRVADHLEEMLANELFAAFTVTK